MNAWNGAGRPGGSRDDRGRGLWSTDRDGSTPVLAVQAIASAGEELDLLPPIVRELVSALCEETWDAASIGRSVAYDRELSALLLAAANSPAMGLSRHVGSVEVAVTGLGPARVVFLAVGASVRAAFEGVADDYGLPRGALWRHSVAAGLAVLKMHRHLPQAPPKLAPTAALLHDVGHLVLARTLPPDQRAVLTSEAARSAAEGRRAEHELLGTDHARIGGALAGHWGLAPAIVDAIACHHRPHELPTAHHSHAAHVVNLADMIASTIGETLGDRERQPADEAGTLVKLGLSGDGWAELCREVFDDLEEVLDAFD